MEDKLALALATEAKETSSLTESYQVILSRMDYEIAGGLLKKIKGRLKALEDRRTFLKKPVLEAGRRIDEWFKGPIGELSGAEKNIKTAMGDYIRREREAAERATQAAREAQEALRIEYERKAKAEEERALSRAAIAPPEAAEIYLEGGIRAAQNIRDLERGLIPPEVKPSLPYVPGQVRRRVWRYRVTDFSLVPDRFKQIDPQAVAAEIRSFKGETSIPGIEVYEDTVIASEGTL